MSDQVNTKASSGPAMQAEQKYAAANWGALRSLYLLEYGLLVVVVNGRLHVWARGIVRMRTLPGGQCPRG
jgi:hypothetical protein